LASLIYIFGRKFPCYLAARMFHGIGSSLIASSSFSLLANLYKTDKERGEIMSKAGSGIACGVLTGPVVGGLLYALGEKMGLGSYARLVPFACVSLADIFSIVTIHFFINSPYRAKKSNGQSSDTIISKEKTKKNLSNWEILKYIPILALVYLSFAGNLQTAYVEPILPNYWIKLTKNNWDTFRSGILFAFSPLSYTIFMPLMGKHGYKIGRHNVMFIGMILISSIALIILPTEKLIYLSALFLFIMGFGSGAIDASLQPMLAQAYDNLLEKKKLKEKKSLTSRKDSDTSTIESDIKLIILPNDEKETDIIDLRNNNNDRIKIRNKNDNTIEGKREEKEEGENDDTIKGKGDDEDKEREEGEGENDETIKGKEENDDDEGEEEEEEDAHNKYTRVFSLGNMAMNIGFITGPMISSFLVASIDGEDPSVNRFKSSFFKCCLIFTAFGCLSSLVAIIPGMKKYQSKKK